MGSSSIIAKNGMAERSSIVKASLLLIFWQLKGWLDCFLRSAGAYIRDNMTNSYPFDVGLTAITRKRSLE